MKCGAGCSTADRAGAAAGRKKLENCQGEALAHAPVTTSGPNMLHLERQALRQAHLVEMHLLPGRYALLKTSSERCRSNLCFRPYGAAAEARRSKIDFIAAQPLWRSNLVMHIRGLNSQISQKNLLEQQKTAVWTVSFLRAFNINTIDITSS